MDSNFNLIDINARIKIIKDNGYAVFPEYVRYLNKWEIVIVPWNYIESRRRPGATKRTGYFFNHNDCVCSQHKETEFAKKMTEVQMKLVEHFTKKQKPMSN